MTKLIIALLSFTNCPENIVDCIVVMCNVVGFTERLWWGVVLCFWVRYWTLFCGERYQTLFWGERYQTLSWGERYQTLFWGERYQTLFWGERYQTLFWGDRYQTLFWGDRYQTLFWGERYQTLFWGKSYWTSPSIVMSSSFRVKLPKTDQSVEGGDSDFRNVCSQSPKEIVSHFKRS